MEESRCDYRIPQKNLLRINPYLLSRAEQIKKIPTAMRHLLLRRLAALACLGIFSVSPIFATPHSEHPKKPDFNGAWTLDLRASNSFDLLMTRIGASFIERKYAAWTKLTAALHQTERFLKIAARGPGFALDYTLYLDGRSYPGNLQLLGATSVNTRTVWSTDYQQLVETHQIKTKQGKEGQLIIKRYLMNRGETLVAVYSLQLNTEPNNTSAQQIWRKRT
jgi:hypothetical protein